MIETIQSRLTAGAPNGAPKYQTLRDAIVDAIASGDWTPGMRLPTEADLAKALPFSLGTVQKAYSELVKNGLVERARGRGSFVASLQHQMSEPWHCRFLADDGTILPIYPKLLGHAVVETHARWDALFGSKAKVVRIDRAVSIDRRFDVISRFFAVERIAKALLKISRTRSEAVNFKTVLLREFAMPITRIAQTIGSADRDAWKRLGLPGRSHLFIEATAYTTGDAVAYFQEFYIPPNDRKLLFDSSLKY
jgi:GntR family transcriptional regulator